MYIMSGNIKTVEFNDAFEYKIINEDLAPLYIKNRGDIEKWIKQRAIYRERPNARAVKRISRLSHNAGDYETAMKVDAANITDNFWIKKDGDSRAYEDIVFKKNDLFRLSLCRDLTCIGEDDIARSPELTNIGTQDKGWNREDGVWWLYKNEPIKEIVSEYITYRLGVAAGLDMAVYEIVNDGEFIKSKDFTCGKYNLQHINGIMVDHKDADGNDITDDDYKYNYDILSSMDPKLAESYLKICAIDALVENYDRHTENYGVLTDRNTGKIISFAPNYDNNNSLYANYNLDIERSGGVLLQFTRFLKESDIKLNFNINIDKVEFEKITGDVKRKTAYDFSAGELKEFIYNGLDVLKDYYRPL